MDWNKIRFLSWIFVCAYVSVGVATQEVPQTLTFDGRAYGDSEATVPMLDTISTKIQILTPAQDCVLYEETQSVDTRSTNGYFTIQIGSAVSDPKRTGYDSNLSMSGIFANRSVVISGKRVTDGTACGYTPASGDRRYVRVQMTPSADGITRSISPNMVLDSVPNAMVAETVQGLAPSDFIQVNNSGSSVLSQSNLENIFSSTNYPNLVNLLSVAPTNYVRTGTNGSATLPSVSGNPASGLTAGQIWYDSVANVIKYYDGSTKTLGTSSGLSSVGLTLPSIFTVTGSPLTANGSISATLANQNANLFFAGPSSGGAAAPTFRAIASSDLPTTGASGMFVNGGNSFGLAATIGTNDANTFTIKTNGTARMSFDTSGNVGIGATAPGTKLTVAGNGTRSSEFYNGKNYFYNGATPQTLSSDSTSVMDVFSSTGSATDIIRWGPTYVNSASISGKLGYDGGTSTVNINADNADLALSVGNSEKMRILNSSGYIGIGTTTPNTRLQVHTPNATNIAEFTVGAGEGITFAHNGPGQIPKLQFHNQLGAVSLEITPGGGCCNSSSFYSNGNFNFNYTGWLGFGFNGAADATAKVEIDGNADGQDLFKISADADAGNQGNILTVKNNGNVGIGTSAPNAGLDVATTGANSAIIVPRDTTANRPTGVAGMIRYNTTTTNFEGYQGSSWKRLPASNNVTCSSASQSGASGTGLVCIRTTDGKTCIQGLGAGTWSCNTPTGWPGDSTWQCSLSYSTGYLAVCVRPDDGHTCYSAPGGGAWTCSTPTSWGF